MTTNTITNSLLKIFKAMLIPINQEVLFSQKPPLEEMWLK